MGQWRRAFQGEPADGRLGVNADERLTVQNVVGKVWTHLKFQFAFILLCHRDIQYVFNIRQGRVHMGDATDSDFIIVVAFHLKHFHVILRL